MGEKVRVSARLLRTADGSSIWEHQSDDYFTDIFTAQDTVSEKIAGALMLGLTGKEQQHLTKRHTIERGAYQLYSKGRYHLFRRTGPDAEKALDYFRQAVALDPKYSLAHEGSAYAYASLRYLARQYDRAIEQLQKTLDLDPNFVTAYQWISESYEQNGDQERAIVWDLKSESTSEKAKALKEAYRASGWRGFWRMRIDLAQEDAKRGYSEPYHLATIHARLGENEQAFAYLHKAYEERSHWLIYLKVDPKLDILRSASHYRLTLKQ